MCANTILGIKLWRIWRQRHPQAYLVHFLGMQRRTIVHITLVPDKSGRGWRKFQQGVSLAVCT